MTPGDIMDTHTTLGLPVNSTLKPVSMLRERELEKVERQGITRTHMHTRTHNTQHTHTHTHTHIYSKTFLRSLHLNQV